VFSVETDWTSPRKHALVSLSADVDTCGRSDTGSTSQDAGLWVVGAPIRAPNNPGAHVMTTKTANKLTKSDRPAAPRRASGTGANTSHDQAATTTIARKREAPSEPRPGQARVTKHALLLQLLSRPEGASIEDMMQTTQWQQHSVRGFLAGTVKKKMGLALTSSKAEGEVRRYRIATRRGR